MPHPVFPSEIIDDTLESYLPQVTVKSQLIYSIVMISFIIALASLPFLYVNVGIKAPGIIRPETEKAELKTLIAGVIDSIFAGEGQPLSPGDPVIRLSSAIPDNRLHWNLARQKEKEAEIADLHLLTRLSAEKNDTPSRLSSGLYRQQYRQFVYKLSENKTIQHKLKEDLRLRQQLYDSGKVISRMELENYRHEYNLAAATSRTVFGQQLSAWQQDLAGARTGLRELRSEQSQLEKEKDFHIIRSPVSGTLLRFRGNYPGNYLQAGEVLGIISPDSGLIAECYVKPSDVGLLQPGMLTRIRVDAFNDHEWGTVSGLIRSVSPDFLVLDNLPVFVVSCTLDKTTMQLKNGYAVHLKKGMTVQAGFIVARRSLGQLLYDKTSRWLKPGNNAY